MAARCSMMGAASKRLDGECERERTLAPLAYLPIRRIDAIAKKINCQKDDAIAKKINVKRITSTRSYDDVGGTVCDAMREMGLVA
jgi:hypothetical protein